MGRVLVLALIVLAPLPAHAHSLAFSDRASWEAAAAGSIHTETFDSVPTQQISGNGGGTLYTPDFDVVIAPGLDTDCCRIADGAFMGDLDLIAGMFNEIVFHTPVTAFAADVLRVELSLELRLNIAGETLAYVPPPFGSPDPAGFFGVVSDTPFTTVRLDASGTTPRFYTLDNVSFAAIPEPPIAEVALIGVILSFVGLTLGAPRMLVQRD